MRGEGSIIESSVESSIVIASEQKLAWQSIKNTSNIRDSQIDSENIDCHSPKGLRNDKQAVDCHDFASAKSRNDEQNTESSISIKPSTAKQLILYFVIGGLITLCELAGFYVMYKFFGLHYILASLLMFVLASAAGIVLYRRFIFGASCLHSSLEIGASYLINTIGVGINTLILWLLVEFAGLEAIYAKVIASLFVAFYGFYARKILIYKKGK